jgi:hypothetical protein
MPASMRADASAAGRAYFLPFSAFCTAKTTPRTPKAAPRILGARAQVTVPSAWRTILVPPNTTSSGGGCEQPYLLTDARGDANECVQQTVYATVAPAGGAGGPAAAIASGALQVLAHGRLPTTSGMRGAWAELAVGVTDAYRSYGVNAAYEAANHRLFYELSVGPPVSESGCPAASASLSHGIARELARSFRVDVTDPATAETTG